MNEGIILKAKPHGDKGFIVTIFSEELGKITGFVRGGKKVRGALQGGNIITFTRYRRLESQLGTLSIELSHDIVSHIFNFPNVLEICSYILESIDKNMKEEDPHPNFYATCKNFLLTMPQKGIWERLGLFELNLLTTMGYGLSLSKTDAVVENKFDEVFYVSPKSGKAVGELKGKPYKDKLLVLPKIFGGKSEDFLDVFKLTGHFLNCTPHGENTSMRGRVIQIGINSGFSDK